MQWYPLILLQDYFLAEVSAFKAEVSAFKAEVSGVTEEESGALWIVVVESGAVSSVVALSVQEAIIDVIAIIARNFFIWIFFLINDGAI